MSGLEYDVYIVHSVKHMHTFALPLFEACLHGAKWNISKLPFHCSNTDGMNSAMYVQYSRTHRRLQAWAYLGIARVILNHAYSYHKGWT